MWNKNFVYVLNHLKIFKAVRKTNPRTPHRNKIKAVLATAANFKGTTLVRSQRQ